MIRDKFKARDGTFKFTGGQLFDMFEELAQPNIPYPYRITNEEIAGMLTRSAMEKLAEAEKLVEGACSFDFNRIKATFFTDETLSKKRETITLETISSVKVNVKAVVLEECHAKSWKLILESISNFPLIMELAVVGCGLVDTDV